MRQVSFAARFLKLTLLGFVLAVVAVGISVWVASRPILQDMQREAKFTHLNTKAEVVSRILDDFTDEGRYAVERTSLQAFVLGQDDLEAQVRDDLSRIAGAQNIRLFDYSGRELLTPRVNEAVSRYLPVEAQNGLASMVEGRAAADPVVQYRPGSGVHNAVFLINVPIVSFGYVEGLLSFEVDSDLAAVLALEGNAAESFLLTAFQVSQWSGWYAGASDLIVVPVARTNFFLAASANASEIATKGAELVKVAIGVAVAALLLPFVVLGVSGFQAIVKPHRQLQKSQSELFEKSERLAELAQIAEMASEAIIVTDAQGRATWVNKAFSDMTGYTANDVLGKNPDHLLQGPETDPETIKLFSAAIEDKQPVQHEILNYTKSGEAYWLNLSVSPIPGHMGGEMRYASIATDISRIKDTQKALQLEKEKTEYQALHDPLTGLPNRRAIDNALEEDVNQSSEPRTLVRIDLDHFKNVNDTLGHAAGDFVLCRVSDILRHTIRKTDLAARTGGDEFVVLLQKDTDEKQALALTEELRLKIKKEMDFEGKTCRVGASFGISSSQNGLVENPDLLKSADSALYVAKEAGRNKTVLYTPSVHRMVVERRKVSSEIENAIHNNEFFAFFQPQFDALTETLVGIEALARWRHPTRGILAPPDFMEAAEKLKFVPDIDRQVFSYGLDCVAALNAEGLMIPKIAFNVGANQLMNPALAEVVQEKNIGFTRIALEILESVLVEDQGQDFLDRVASLRNEDFQIEVDDFGSGHASVIGLQRLQPHIMKIDRELVFPVTESKMARSLAKSIVDMGHALNIKVIAEGVETAQHAAIMRDLGCDAFQGFYFARPMPFEDLKEYAARGFDQKLGKVTSFAARADK